MRQGFLPSSGLEFVAAERTTGTPGTGDPWMRLAEISARAGSDPALAALIDEAIRAQQGLRAVTIAIATRYRSLIDAVPDAVTIHDEAGNVLDANIAAYSMYGYDHEALTRLSVLDLNPSLPADHMDRLIATFDLGTTSTVETVNRRADGSTFPVEVHSNMYLDGDRKRIIAVARDISARHATDAELRASEARFRLLMQAMDKGVIVQDGRGAVLSCNPAACRIFGYAESELVGRRAEHHAQWWFVDEAGEPLRFADLPSQRALRSGSTVGSTTCGVFVPRAGVLCWLSITSVPQFIEGRRRPFRVVSTFSDITAMKRETEMFAQAQALANIGGWQLDLPGGTLNWTDHLYTIFDLPPGTPITLERMLAFFPSSDRERMQRSLGDARSGTPIELDLRMNSSIGRRRWVRVIARPNRHGENLLAIVGTLQDITERKLVEENLRQQAVIDSVTGLPNQDAMIEMIESAIASAPTGHGPALLYLNLDRFRTVNDLLGHDSGDRMLAIAAKRLQRILPDAAQCARFGGDEFVVLLPSAATPDDPVRIATELAAEFNQPVRFDGREFCTTASIGIACHPHDGVAARQLLGNAGAAMVEAKRRGRNTWQRFSPDLARRASNRVRIETHLRGALAGNEFHLVYQPQVDLADGTIVAAEALLRWISPELGEMSPDVFIPYAENTGDIVAIGAWAIRESCRQIRAWRDSGTPIARVAVNVSYRQVLGGTLASTVIAALREFDLPGEALELEMTERILIEDASDGQQTFATLQGLGVKIVIDDFGEGYSALGYLRRLPIDGIKISHGFLQHVPGNPADTAICEAIIRIGRSLGLSVIGEGVESEHQRRFLIDHGAKLAQGFLFSRALKPVEFAEFARGRLRSGC